MPDGLAAWLRWHNGQDEDMIGAFVDYVDALRCELPELHVLCTGPWPPYSFVAE